MISKLFSRSSSKRGFTLIELLVVISIIALLIGILLPALGKARDAANAALCMANERSMGQAFNLYQTEYHGYFPTSYQYRSTNDFMADNISTNVAFGYLHWSGIMARNGYLPFASNAYVCPKHVYGGWNATNYVLAAQEAAAPGTVTTANWQDKLPLPAVAGSAMQQPETPGVVDTQAPKLSYTANEAIVPRMKTGAIVNGGILSLAKSDEVTKGSYTVLLSEQSDWDNAIEGSSTTGGAAYKEHRPFHAFAHAAYSGSGITTAANVYQGENTALGTQTLLTRYYAITTDQAKFDLQQVNPSTTDTGLYGPGKNINNGNGPGKEACSHIVYLAPQRHSDSSNYVFADGHAATKKLEDLLNQDDWAFGLKVYTLTTKPPVVKQNGTDAVQ